jgi:uncharacterized protein involved in outer membrane biogenesis
VLLTAVATLVTLVVLVLVGVNLYIQSPGTQARIQEGVSAALRMPVRFMSTSISLGGQVKINGITVPDGEHSFLEANSFNARYRLAPLLRGRFEIYGMNVERPTIVWRQNAEGHWVMPRTPKDEGAKLDKDPKPVVKEEKKRSGLEVVIEGFQVRDGSVELRDKDDRIAADFSGVNVTYTTLTAERMAGTAQIARVAWGQSLIFENVRTPFQYAGREVALPDLTATLAGGAVTGNFTLSLDKKKSPYTMALAFKDVEAGKLSEQIHSALGKASGTIGGQLELHGSVKDIDRSEGAGALQIRDGRFQKLDLLEAIGEVLQIKELADLKLTDGRANFRIGDRRAFIDELTLDAADLRLSAKGTLRFEGKIQLAARLSIDEALRKHLPGLIRGNFEEDGDRRYAIDFDITGKDFKAKTNLLDKVVGKKLTSQFEDLLSSLFGSKKKDEKKPGDEKKDKEKKAEMPAPAAPPGAPAAAAEPVEN